jgi:hypothetical protein
MVHFAEGPRCGARVGKNRLQRQVEQQRWRKKLKAMSMETATKGGKEDYEDVEDSLFSSLLNFRPFSAHLHRH